MAQAHRGKVQVRQGTVQARRGIQERARQGIPRNLRLTAHTKFYNRKQQNTLRRVDRGHRAAAEDIPQSIAKITRDAVGAERGQQDDVPADKPTMTRSRIVRRNAHSPGAPGGGGPAQRQQRPIQAPPSTPKGQRGVVPRAPNKQHKCSIKCEMNSRASVAVVTKQQAERNTSHRATSGKFNLLTRAHICDSDFAFAEHMQTDVAQGGFPVKLWSMMNNASIADVVHWGADGTSIVVSKVREGNHASR
jgi:hypothetical protein